MVAKQKILIVDDDENIAELISLYLVRYRNCYQRARCLRKLQNLPAKSDFIGHYASGHGRI